MNKYHALGLTALMTCLPSCSPRPIPPVEVVRVREIEQELQTMPLTREDLLNPKTSERFDNLRIELQSIISEEGFNEKESEYLLQERDFENCRALAAGSYIAAFIGFFYWAGKRTYKK